MWHLRLMVCLNQFLLALVQFVGGPAVVIGVTVKVLGWLNLYPVFQYMGDEVHQYSWYGRTRRTVNAKIRLRLGFWSTEIQASLRLAKDGKDLDPKYWLAWDEEMNPAKTKIAPRHVAWVRVLSVDEHDKTTGVPLSVGDGRIGFSHIPDGEYDVQLWARCSFWAKNEGQKLLHTWHWQIPDDIMNREYKT